jgi:P27 family predicted phage terminase small subunit
MRGARPELRVVENGSEEVPFKGSDTEPLNAAECGISTAEIPQSGKSTGAELSPVAPPVELPEAIAAEWHRVVTDLRERRLWKDSMSGMVTSFVLAQATLLRLEISIAAEGDSVVGASGARKPHPSTGLLRSSRETVARLGAELGLSPTARSRKQLRPDGPDLFSSRNNEFDL